MALKTLSGKRFVGGGARFCERSAFSLAVSLERLRLGVYGGLPVNPLGIGSIPVCRARNLPSNQPSLLVGGQFRRLARKRPDILQASGKLSSMQNHFGKIGAHLAVAVLCLAHAANAQAPPTPAQTTSPSSSAVANPTYVSIHMEVTVNRPATEVWKRIGKYCDIGEWMQVACTINAGKDGEIGAVRSVGNEVLVGKTELSYTYTQPVREGRPYNLYHGTLEARPLTTDTSKLIYTLIFDNSMLADDAAREKDKAQRTARFTQLLQNMKVLAEGGTLPLPAARGGAPKQ
jgi:hypothetical protein